MIEILAFTILLISLLVITVFCIQQNYDFAPMFFGLIFVFLVDDYVELLLDERLSVCVEEQAKQAE